MRLIDADASLTQDRCKIDASLTQDRCKIDASSDVISRQDAVETMLNDRVEITDFIKGLGKEREFEILNATCDRHAKMLEELPSAERTGHWIDKNYGGWNTIRVFECSACGKTDERIHDSANYCPNCGASMRGDTDD